jgi:LysM repeat protein
MALSETASLSFAKQGLEIDKARLNSALAEKAAIVDVGGNTRAIDTKIKGLQEDVAASEQDVIDAQAEVDAASSETAADAVANNESKTTLETQNTGTDAEEVSDEDLSDEEEEQIEEEPDEPELLNRDDEDEPDNAEDNEDSDPETEEEVVQVGGPKSRKIIANNNPLGWFSSYTYNINLHVLTKKDYTQMVNDPTNFRPSRNLISGSNRYGTKYTGQPQGTGTYRDPAFMDDFYFDNLKMTTVIGLNSQARGTNAITMSFTIIEPYGMTLMDRILDINNNELNAKNYLDSPYLLELNFFGIDDDGVMGIIPEQTKWFPIKIISFKIKAGTKGAEYAVEAIPFNHQAQFESVQILKTRMEVTASTVGEYFKNVGTGNSDFAEQSTVEDQNEDDSKHQTVYYESDGSSSTSYAPKPIPPVKTDSFTDAYNAWNLRQMKKGNIKVADQIRFKIHPKIAGSAIVESKKNSIRKVPAMSSKTAAQGNDSGMTQAQQSAVVADFNKIVHSLDAGTAITDIINMVITNSDYVQKQIKDASTQATDKNGIKEVNPLSLFKIIPEVALTGYDDKSGSWSKTITFHIRPYKVHNGQDPRAPKSPPPPAVKQYEYMYTGQNSDIISFDIDFNALYFTAISVDKGKTSATAGSESDPDDDTVNKTDVNGKAATGTIANHTSKPVAGTQEGSTGGATTKSAATNAASVMQSFYTSAAGDMINLKLQILGDPEFIKQDDLFVSPDFSGTDEDAPQFVNGSSSLTMDAGEIYCRVIFKTPRDFDSSTGLYLQNTGKYSVSNFSGYYKVIKVDSEFRSGKFLQTLELIRYPNQTPEESGVEANSIENNPDLREQEQTDAELNSESDIEEDTTADTEPDEPELLNGEEEDEDASDEPDEPEEDTEEDTELEDVVDDGDEFTVDEATSPDKNEVPIQNPPEPGIKDYLIKPGDNLTKIAAANKTSVDYLMLINPQISNPNLIYAGQTMNIPTM